MTEMNDEFFINLTMDMDNKDMDVYRKWALWCYNSNHKYYIDGKDRKFFTHVRTDEEQLNEIKRDGLHRFLMEERHKLSESNGDESKFGDYERYFFDNMMDNKIKDFLPKTYEQWVTEQVD